MPRMRGSTVAGALGGTMLGIVLGLGGFTFLYAKGASYLKNDPAACANCHVMWEQYNGWLRSPHHAVATCNDCHTPHNLLGKYAVKAENGFWHSFYFTTGAYPDVLSARPVSRRIVEDACRHCHGSIAGDISAHDRDSLSCLACHHDVGHP
jgi:cytochrome c nitrite reductase small subunit